MNIIFIIIIIIVIIFILIFIIIMFIVIMFIIIFFTIIFVIFIIFVITFVSDNISIKITKDWTRIAILKLKRLYSGYSYFLIIQEDAAEITWGWSPAISHLNREEISVSSRYIVSNIWLRTTNFCAEMSIFKQGRIKQSAFFRRLTQNRGSARIVTYVNNFMNSRITPQFLYGIVSP